MLAEPLGDGLPEAGLVVHEQEVLNGESAISLRWRYFDTLTREGRRLKSACHDKHQREGREGSEAHGELVRLPGLAPAKWVREAR